MKYIFLLSLISLLVACSNSKTVEIKDDQGRVVERYQITEDSLKSGKYEVFYSSGKTKETANYLNGKLHGQRILYFENGQAEIEENYSEDKMHGLYKAYFENGQVNLEVEYVNSLMQGVLKRYYDNGQTQEEVTFVDSEENGPFKEYFSTGQVEWEGAYKNGDNEEGLLVQYLEDGSIKKKMNCTGGVCRTIWTPEKGDITPVY